MGGMGCRVMKRRTCKYPLYFEGVYFEGERRSRLTDYREDYERVFMQVKVRPYEVLFRGNGNRGDLTEVVTTLAVEDWDGTKVEFQALLGPGDAKGSLESPVVID